MRMLERTLTEVELFPRACAEGSLGGRAEVFSDEPVAMRASVLPEKGDMEKRARGMTREERLRLLVPADEAVCVGDGVRVRGRMYRVVSLATWTAHRELICEAMDG